MSSSPSAPQPINPAGVASSQTQENTTAAQASQSGTALSGNQSNAYGEQSVSQVGTDQYGNPIYSTNVSLSPTQQGLYNAYTGTQQQAGNEAANALGFGNYGNVSAANQIGNMTSGLTGAATNQEIQYLEPYFQAQQSQLNTQLENEGIMPSKTGTGGVGSGGNVFAGGTGDPGNPAWNNAQLGLENAQTNQIENFIAQTQPQMMQQATTEYELPAQMAENLATFGAPTTPNSSFVNTAALNISPANYEGDVQTYEQAQQADQQIAANQQNAMMSGLFGTGSAVLGGWAKSGGLQSLLAAAGPAAIMA